MDLAFAAAAVLSICQSATSPTRRSPPRGSPQPDCEHRRRPGFGPSPAGVPPEWVHGIGSLDHHRAPKDVPLHRWRVFVDDCQRFLLAKDNWPERAAKLDWDAHALFGCRTVRPLEHLASAGLLWAINGGKLIELHRDWAVVERAADRSHQVHHRRCRAPANVTLPWTAKGSHSTVAGEPASIDDPVLVIGTCVGHLWATYGPEVAGSLLSLGCDAPKICKIREHRCPVAAGPAA